MALPLPVFRPTHGNTLQLLYHACIYNRTAKVLIDKTFSKAHSVARSGFKNT
jgi:hypothetical protein